MYTLKHLFSTLLIAAIALSPGITKAQTFGTPIPVQQAGFGTGANVGEYSDMIIVNGNPAICYYDNTRDNLMFVRATNTSGTAWGTPVTLDVNGDVGQYTSMKIVNGNPAIAYYDVTNGDLKYIRANDASGTTWGTPQTVDASGTCGEYASLQVINGNPAISYYDNTNGDLKYVRASNADGSSWNAAVTVTSSGNVGLWASLEVVSGNPAIAYQDLTNEDAKYVRATDVSGTSWGTPVTAASSGQVGYYCSMQVVNGNPAIAHYNASAGTTHLQYVRASSTDGSTWGSSISVGGSNDVGYTCHLLVVNGNPAIASWDRNPDNLQYVRSSDASGTSWNTPVTVLSTGAIGLWPTIVIANGNPLIAVYDQTNGDQSIVRASDANGGTWGSKQSIDGAGTNGSFTSAAIVNSNPAMSYYDLTNSDLKYVRASNAGGSSWATPVTVEATGQVGVYTSLKVVNSNPAIAYQDFTTEDLKFVRASDASGTSWGSPQTVDATGSVGYHISLNIVNSNPAISYYDQTNGDLRYIRASDASGTSWGSPQTIDATGNVGLYTSLCIVNGNPAIAYYDNTNGDLKYVRASDASGSSWGSPQTIASTDNVGFFASLCVVNGNPAISYYDLTNGDLKYVRASDASGSSWGSPQTLDATGDVGYLPSLCIVNGNPAISYNDNSNTDLKYIRATDASGSSWGSSVILDATGGQYASMVANGADVFIGYYNNTDLLPYYVQGSSNSWTGTTNTTWGTTTNWSLGAAPASTDNVAIPAGCPNYPDITSGTVSCKSITIKSGASVTVNGGTLQIGGEISNSGTFTATNGTIELNGSSAQTIPANTFATNTVKSLTLNNSTGATLSGTLNITDTYTPTSGTLTTGGFLTLKSTSSSATARIAAGNTGGGYVSGNVTVERYIPGGRRAFRFLAHPFTSALAMSELTDDINITGTGGSPFTTTGTNNPSAYNFDAATGDNSTTGTNPGWTAFTASSTWAQYQGMRVLVRGALGEGLTSAAYTPSAVTLDMAGAVNQGDITMSLTKGSGTDFIIVGNPFPSQINMTNTTSRTNVGSAFFVWDANQGTKGGYTSVNYAATNYILPAYASFVTTLSASGSITFPEACKSATTPNALFKTTAIPNTVQLRLEDSTIFWDRLLLTFDDNAMATVDYPDASKLYNPDMSFYTLSKDDSMLSIDTRPYVENEIIPLGLYSTLQKSFKIVATDFDVPAGTKLFLTDKFLNKKEEVTAGFEYWFTVTADTASWGNNRFELNTQGKPTNSISNNTIANKLKVKLVPNPTTDNVTLYYEGADSKELNITITNAVGVKVAEATQSNTNGSVTIPMQNAAAGMYIVTIKNGNETVTQKLIKQ